MKKALKRASQRKTGTGGESKLEKLTKEAISFPGDIRGVEKSALDKREYRTFKLENEIEVLLISDSRTEASGAALSVNVGSFSDPEECPGLAHFLEHMLFMGTEKYPDENGYSKYLSENGGYSNAYTADEETNYQFQVMSGKLEHALDMFAQFFIGPLFNQSSTDRELQAVDNECTGNLQSDGWRNIHVKKALANPQHPFHKFNIGNVETLRDTPSKNGVNVRKYLLEFYDRYYSANLMKLVILGRESLDTLEGWAMEKFSPIGNKSIESPYAHPNPTGPAFTTDNLGIRVDIVPVKELRQLSINWLIDPVTYKNKNVDAAHYLGALIGDEGVGSVLTYLKEMGWANSLYAGSADNAFDFATFNVTIGCTEDGIKNHVEDITKVVYAYVGLVRENWDKIKWFYEQESQLGVINFRFKGEEQPFRYVTHLASSMHNGYPIQKILTQNLHQGFPYDAISTLVENFTPERSLISIIHKSVEEYADKTERWFGTKYTVNPLGDAFVTECLNVKVTDYAGKLSLPPRNEFIPETFAIKSFVRPTVSKVPESSGQLLKNVTSSTQVLSLKSLTHVGNPNKRSVALATTQRDITQVWDEDTWRPPVLLEVTSVSNLWFKQDVAFKRPIAIIRLTLKTKILNESPRTALLSTLYKSIINDTLNEQVYPAMMAGLAYGAGFDDNGIYLSFQGYNDKLEAFMKFVSDNIKTPARFEQSQFDRFKEALLKGMQNYTKADPYRLCYSNANYALENKGWTVDEKLEALAGINFEDVRAFGPKMFQNLSMEMSVYGNATPEDAKRYMKTAKSSFAADQPISESLQDQTVKLKDRCQYYLIRPTLDMENPNSAIVVVFQMGKYDRAESTLCSVFSSMCHESFFNILRTNEQLGYVVSSQKGVNNGVIYQAFIVQSNSKDPLYLDRRVESFLEEFEKVIMGLSEEDFDRGVQSYINDVLSASKNLFKEEGGWASEIQSEIYDFSSKIHLANTVAQLTVEDLRTMFKKYFPKDAPHRKKFVSGIVADVHAKALFGENYTIPEKVDNQHIAFGEDLLKKIVEANPDEAKEGGEIIYIQNSKEFRDASELYPSFVQMMEAGI
uniref:Insulysin n=2 Tax=Sar TaxID=2698737 RepID=A0A7S3V286_9STRA|mmetsp:Transcript_19436/g.24756  ORF Transcript_19436/g.24756 Transcript_19436/m.24756 type:complete len:1083 (+) Transcript_19436:209-3457(+)|eukprot:CAMPEP_0204864422 /NCGR_PEP_ID=MMETSP1348-20121228/4050_1 /ASSEMBLY_ACC=CAM_ASM_000700 /TAXON_ID=215587 /ORGANISM="Aplanochytrium stocchinoi, Strain GSBS06" /LENGTH=1082 /DNA_ID=CAMNT_0052015055 /DNA_START=189 /DNA_END=3437 /DNA_ORIENTATION=+